MIIMDSREKDMDKYLRIEGLEFKTETLSEGDYTNEIGSFYIERKRGNDLLNSLTNKKLYAQLIRMAENHPDSLRYILFEGDFNAFVMSQTNQSLAAMLIAFKHQVGYIFGAQWIETYDKFHTCREIRYIDKYSRSVGEKPIWEPLHIKSNWDERLRVVMSMTPRIGQKGAELVLEKFKSVQEYYESCKNNQKEVLSMKNYGKTKLNNTLEIMQSTEPFIKKRNRKKAERTNSQNEQANKKRKAYYAKQKSKYQKKSKYSTGVY